MKKLAPFLILILLTSCQSKLDKFAQCLNDEGAVFYGSQSCEHCKEQKEFFAESAKYLHYVECDEYAKDSDHETCESVKINAYPTWIFKDGTYLVGKQTFKDLSDKTTCEIPL